MCSICYNSCVKIIAQAAIASQLLVVGSRKVASVRAAIEMHRFYFEQLLVVDNSQLKVASLRGPLISTHVL